MKSLLDILSAEKTKNNIEKLTNDMCYGCFIDHPSQTQHTCLMDTLEEKLDNVCVEALDNVYMTTLVDQWMAYVTQTHFTTSVHPVHLIKYSCSDWLETTYKSVEWRERIRNLLLQIYEWNYVTCYDIHAIFNKKSYVLKLNFCFFVTISLYIYKWAYFDVW